MYEKAEEECENFAREKMRILKCQDCYYSAENSIGSIMRSRAGERKVKENWKKKDVIASAVIIVICIAVFALLS